MVTVLCGGEDRGGGGGGPLCLRSEYQVEEGGEQTELLESSECLNNKIGSITSTRHCQH